MISGQINMIEIAIFDVYLTENCKVNIISKYTFEEKLTIIFKEKYTGLSIFKSSNNFIKDINYWYKIGPSFNIINGIIIEIHKNDDILYKETINLGKNIQIKLKNKIFYDKYDSHAWAPFYEVFIKKIYENNLINLKPNDVVVDLGANIGMFSLYACDKVKKVYSVEPLHNTYQNLTFNLRNYSNVETFNYAIYSKEGELNFFRNEISGASSIINKLKNHKTEKVKAISFNTFIKENKIGKINFLKIDIEGAEFDLFNSIDEKYLKNIDKMYIEVHLMENFKLNNITDKISKYFIYNFENEGVDRNGIKLYTISCINKLHTN